MPRKPGRPKAGSSPLDREAVISAALTIINQQGIDALSMRRIASALNVDPMAIYNHVPSKAALIQAVIAQVFADLPEAPDSALSWQDQIRATAHAYHGLIRAHPELVIALVSEGQIISDAPLRVGERLYAALQQTQLAPREMVHAADLIIDFLHGYALGERSGRLGAVGERRDFMQALFQTPDEALPATKAVFAGMDEDEVLSDLDAGLDLILRGIAARPAQASQIE